MINYPYSFDNDDTLYHVTDLAKTQLVEDVDDVQTTIHVIDTSKFPNSGIIRIGDELIKYSSKTPTTFEGCIRGWGNTTPTSHSVNSIVFLPILGEHHNVLKDVIIELEKAVGLYDGGGSLFERVRRLENTPPQGGSVSLKLEDLVDIPSYIEGRFLKIVNGQPCWSSVDVGDTSLVVVSFNDDNPSPLNEKVEVGEFLEKEIVEVGGSERLKLRVKVDDNQITNTNLWSAQRIVEEIQNTNPITTFVELNDTPPTYTPNTIVVVNDEGNGLEFENEFVLDGGVY